MFAGQNSTDNLYNQLIGCAQAQSGASSAFGIKIEVPIATIKKEEYSMFKSIRNYYEKYQDIILTVGAIFLLDHYMFDGKFRTKIEQIMESLISKATSKIKAVEAANE